MVLRPYQNVKSIRQVVFKLSRSQAISCIGYNVNLQTAVAPILVFVECLKSIVSEVFVVLRPYQNVKSIRQAVFKISRSQAIVDRRTAGQTDGQGHSIIRRAYKNTKYYITITKLIVHDLLIDSYARYLKSDFISIILQWINDLSKTIKYLPLQTQCRRHGYLQMHKHILIALRLLSAS